MTSITVEEMFQIITDFLYANEVNQPSYVWDLFCSTFLNYPYIENTYGDTPYSFLMYYHIDNEADYNITASWLEDNQTFIKFQDRFGRTALHHACIHNQQYLARMMVGVGFSMFVKDDEGKSPYDYASEHEDQGNLIMMNEYIHIPLSDSRGRTVLHHACLYDDVPGVDELWHYYDMDMYKEDVDGVRPYDLIGPKVGKFIN